MLNRPGFKPEKQSHHCVFLSYRRCGMDPAEGSVIVHNDCTEVKTLVYESTSVSAALTQHTGKWPNAVDAAVATRRRSLYFQTKQWDNMKHLPDSCTSAQHNPHSHTLKRHRSWLLRKWHYTLKWAALSAHLSKVNMSTFYSCSVMRQKCENAFFFFCFACHNNKKINLLGDQE